VRHLKRDDGGRDTYRLRRLICKECGKLHTEMPDKFQPYKHYSSAVIEATIDDARSDCPADNATISRWKSDFKASSGQLESVLRSYWMKYRKQSFPLLNDISLLKTIRKHNTGWLAIVTRLLINTGYGIHTRFAFCPQ
jgi:hypothetical protein